MIDLEKEKQLMINAMRESGVIEIKPNTHQFHEHLKTWCKRAELAQAEITKLKQKLKKLESGEFVLVPRFLNEEKQDAINELIAESVYIETSWGGVNSVDWTQGLDKALYELILGVQETLPEPPKPTNLIDNFIADGGFDRAIGCKNGE